MSQRNDRASRVVIGLGATLGSLVLLYFSATPALVCAPGAEYVHCTVTAHAVGFVEVHREQAANVRSVALEVAAGSSTSRTPPRLVFRDPTTSHDLGYFSQRFASDWRALDEYARSPNAPTLRLDTPFTARTAGAYAAALVLGLLGVSTLLSAVRR